MEINSPVFVHPSLSTHAIFGRGQDKNPVRDRRNQYLALKIKYSASFVGIAEARYQEGREARM